MTHKVARNTREILNKQEAISVLLEISQCFMAQMISMLYGSNDRYNCRLSYESRYISVLHKI